MIVLLAHGSPDPRHRVDVQDLANRVGVLLGERVQVAYLEHQQPTLGHVAAEAVPVDGSVVILPLLLAAGFHARSDVPELLAEVRQQRPDVTWQVLPTLPPGTLASAVLDALGDRSRSGTYGEHPRAVVGVVAGSVRSGALDAFEELAAALRPAGVELLVANGPTAVPAAGELAQLLCEGAPVEVVSLMFADGVLMDRARVVAGERGWPVAQPLGRTAACAAALANWIRACLVSLNTLPGYPGRPAMIDTAP